MVFGEINLDDIEPYNKVWVKDGNTLFPGTVMSIDSPVVIVLKYYEGTYANVTVGINNLAIRVENITHDIYTHRKGIYL